MTRRMTRGEAEIEALLERLEPGSERHRVLFSAREFKASWVELGQNLTSVREHDNFKEWGHSSFDAYCRRELRLKKDTALKLTRSFSFLRDHQPEALSTLQDRELPALDVVDMLSQARERSNVSDDQFETIRNDVFEPVVPPTKNDIVKRFREFDPEAFKSKKKDSEKTGGDEELRKALLLAERLQGLLETLPDISEQAVDSLRRVSSQLRKQFDQSRVEDADESAE